MELFAKIYFFGWGGVVLGDDVGVSRYGIDDDGGVVLARTADFDGLGAVIDDNHLFEVDFGLEVFASLEDVARHLLALLHDCNLFNLYAWFEFNNMSE